MLRTVWTTGLSLLLTCAAASAAKVEMKAKTTDWQTQYFDASEVSTDLYEKMTEDGQNSDIPRVYQFKVEPEWGQGPATMCVKIAELKKLEKAMFSSTKTAQYVLQLVNASKITKVTTFKADDYTQFGLSEQDQFWLSYVYLNTGEKLTAINPRNNSGYLVCGMQNGEVKTNSKFSKTVQRHTVLKDSCAGYTEAKDQIMASLSLDTSFSFGAEPKALLEDCAAKTEVYKQKVEVEKQKAAQARVDADAKFEELKAKHKMLTGIQLLGDIGADSAKRLVKNCEDTPNFLQPNRGESSMTKEQWRQSHCGGYYKEEVADLLRELRIRGIVSN
jgi:hypothetical protein